jgi:aerobic carbon-monoxide dehydrogenase medium subunit
MPTLTAERLYVPSSLGDALAALGAGDGARPLAGATWEMRAPLRGEALAGAYVGIGHLDELRDVDLGTEAVGIGACVTHAQLGRSVAEVPGFGALATAAAASANPGIRSMATVGGNLCSTAFAAADLVPALLCLDAEVVIARGEDRRRLPLPDFLASRDALEVGSLLTEVIVPRTTSVSAHARLTLRAAGDYPVAHVSIGLQLDDEGRVEAARVAVGSVEPVARRWPELEAALTGRPIDPEAGAAAARDASGTLQGRDGIEAEGWYRVSVVPTLVRRALTTTSATG